MAEKQIEEVQNEINDFVNSSHEIVTYITDNNSENDSSSSEIDAMLGMFAMNVVDRAETICRLCPLNRYDSVGVLTRSIFEVYLYLLYILQKDTDRRVKAFLYHSRLNNITCMIDFEKNNGDEHSQYSLEEISAEVPGAESLNDMKEHYEGLFINLFKHKPKKWWSRNWYDLDQSKKTNIPNLMKRLEIDHSLYSEVYKLYSMDVHGSNLLNYTAALAGKNSGLNLATMGNLAKIVVRNSLEAILNYYKLDAQDMAEHFVILEKSITN
ncbi:DUF5677 domain-containing protein [Enterococcus faecalis]|uniref:DUF5677 domain-containing protein n=1 Tax=Enterococcus TaxID=1350 RepID=UPI000DEB72B4|nr:DUF5677 domain-containing protein [Enterococcus faecalis]ELY1999544.1 hypothetical protein [Enterococcus faecalis]RBR39516.1 hypothetical protein EA76_02779 [Enterococcus faecalis]